MGEATSSPERSEWLSVVEGMFSTLPSNGSWKTLCNIPTGTRVIPSGVILRRKCDSTGLSALFKARLVACGNFQPDLDD